MCVDIVESFRWTIDPDGYKIDLAGPLTVGRNAVVFEKKSGRPILGYIDAELQRQRMIVPKGWHPSIARVMRQQAPCYYPMGKAHTGLFREFAEVRPTDNGILQFSNKYGLLGIYRTPVGGPVDEGEPVSVWRDEQRQLVAALKEHEAGTGRRALDALVTSKLQMHSPWRLTSTDEGRELGPYPTSLLGAIWLQLAFAIVERVVDYRRCRFCLRPFEVSKGPSHGRRVDAEFCSRICKNKDYRRRRTIANRLTRSTKGGSAVGD
jgi:hypothetical protein